MTLRAAARPTGVRRFLPGVASIGDGVRRSPVADGRAALTVWAVVVPQSLAYATLAGVPSVVIGDALPNEPSGSYPSSATIWASARDADPKTSQVMISRSADMDCEPSRT